jgi:hypothetical protein
VDRTEPNVFQTPTPGQDDRIDPPGGYAAMPPSAPDPAAGGTAPATGDVPPMRTPASLRRFDAWNYPEDSGIGDGADIVGYRIEAIDGHIGKVDEASTLVDDSYLVVDTGPWIFGKKVLLPAGTVNNVDPMDQKVYVDRTKSQIKDSPEFDPDSYSSPEYRDKVGDYYGTTYAGAPYGMPVHPTVTDARVDDRAADPNLPR